MKSHFPTPAESTGTRRAPTMPSTSRPRLTVGVVCRDRQTDLDRCLDALRELASIELEVIVIDDGSVPPLAPLDLSKMLPSVAQRLVRCDESSSSWRVGGRNYLRSRNQIVQEASASTVLIFDDDASIRPGAGPAFLEALDLIERDPRIGSVAFRQLNANLEPHSIQASKFDYPTFIRTFWGYAWMVKRDPFLAVGGLREDFGFYHEEEELSKRLLGFGLRCLWWPAGEVVHIPSSVGRSDRWKLLVQNGLRNRALDAIANEPLPMMLQTVRGCLAAYRIKCREAATNGTEMDPRWLWRELVAAYREGRLRRRPLSLRACWQWRSMRAKDGHRPPPYLAPPIRAAVSAR